MMPELTKEEYIRLELTKSYIRAMPSLITDAISNYVNLLTDGILNPRHADSGSNAHDDSNSRV